MADQLVYSTRREFLCRSMGTLSLSATLPGFLARTAAAFADQQDRAGRVLVMLQLAGGNDGLNTVVPYADDLYHRARPGLAIQPDRCLKLDDHVGLHPALSGLKALYDDGLCAVVQGVGYPNPNRSHFKSMDIWHTADAQARTHSGWLGRYFDNCCGGSPTPDPEAAIALMSEAPLALSGEHFGPLAFRSERELKWRGSRGSRQATKIFEALNSGPRPDEDPRRKDRNEALDYLRRATLEARLGADEIHQAVRGLEGVGGGRGNPLRRQLALVLRMITADFPTRVYYVSHSGYDTHANQDNRHQQLLKQLGDGVEWFIKQLKTHHLLDRVLVVSFSEFGRRVAQNASAGTDHGAAAPMLLLGSRVRPGVHLKHPALDKLQDGDLLHGCDFRQVYAAVLRDWLQAQPQKILRGNFKPPAILKSK